MGPVPVYNLSNVWLHQFWLSTYLFVFIWTWLGLGGPVLGLGLVKNSKSARRVSSSDWLSGSEAENNSFQKVFYGNYESLFVCCITGKNSRDLLRFGNP